MTVDRARLGRAMCLLAFALLIASSSRQARW